MAWRTGYLMVDHSNSPGLPEDIARQSGYNPALCKEGKRFEADTLKCAHCAVSVLKSPMRDTTKMPRNKCPKCRDSAGDARYICDVCAFRMTLPDYIHVSYQKYIDVCYDASANGKSPNVLIIPG
jgi:hypothetical protein